MTEHDLLAWLREQWQECDRKARTFPATSGAWFRAKAVAYNETIERLEGTS